VLAAAAVGLALVAGVGGTALAVDGLVDGGHGPAGQVFNGGDNDGDGMGRGRDGDGDRS
jgi:hypothetical protein